LADAEVLPYEFGNFADTVHKYNKELQKLLKDKQDEITEQNKELEEGAYKAADDPRKPTVPPKHKDVPPYLNFAPLQNAADTLTRSAERYERAFAAAQSKVDNGSNSASITELNRQLIETERALTNDAGLPRRSWYKHLLYAPGVYTGYQPKTVPGVREGIEQDRYSEAEQEIVRVSKALNDEAAIIDKASGILESLK
jgi:N-acetylated-alpha-linked acidic dipeptidase